MSYLGEDCGGNILMLIDFSEVMCHFRLARRLLQMLFGTAIAMKSSLGLLAALITLPRNMS